MKEQKGWLPDKSKFKDSRGRYITQSLFLENGYNTEFAVYTLTDEDKEYQGVVYPSLRRLYLECLDPTEYTFATKYLWGWEHWLRICDNSLMTQPIEQWREELEVRLRSIAITSIVASAPDSYNAAKWVADGSWQSQRGKAAQKRAKRIREKVAQKVDEDSDRVVPFIRPKESNDT